MKITTKSGFKCNVDENRLKDWRYVSLSAKMTKQTDEVELISGLDELLTFIMGDEQKNEFLTHLAKKNGVAESSVVAEEFKHITEMMGEQLKKSMASQA